ncbi:hypothetical protein PoB_001743700 [Plakobranchus ocellatus]|uniref:Uncharacterized protein n=1 Tax=Plakobranchus ocellatus TaxID=259542 RepID=A0AAV3Z6N4_9GAST|nr:hypothetical protein PoB_001743700 [Plakobranchus ocellatus]
MGFSPTVRQSFPCQQLSGPKIDTHVDSGIIMRGTTLGPKHNVRKRTLPECVDHGRFTGSRRRWSSEANSYANHFHRHTVIEGRKEDLYIASPQQSDLKLLGPRSGQGADGETRTRDRRFPADLRADSLTTVSPTPLLA